jgi:hypothetical protein
VLSTGVDQKSGLIRAIPQMGISQRNAMARKPNSFLGCMSVRRNSILGCAAVLGLAGCHPEATLPPNVDRKAMVLLNEMEQKLASAPTLEASGVVERRNPKGELETRSWQRIRFVRPERLLVTVDSARSMMNGGKMGELSSSVQSFDGSVEQSWWSGGDVIRKYPQDEPPRFPFKVLAPAYKAGAKHFWPGQWSANRIHDLTLLSLAYVGRERSNGAELDVIRWVTRGGYFAPEGDFTDTTYIYLAADRTPSRMRTVTSRGSSTEEHITRLTLNAPLTADDATYKLPPGARVDSDYTAVLYNPEHKPYHDYAGKVAPDFSISTAQGLEFSLAAQRVKRRFTVVYIWFYG